MNYKFYQTRNKLETGDIKIYINFVKNFFSIVLFSLLLSASAHAECVKGDCVNGFSKIQYSNGYYIGEFKNKKEDGQGTYVWNYGDKYIGEWKDGNMTGQGTYTWPSGNKYIGEWKDGIRTGQGIFFWKDGDKYYGEFYKNKLNGEGTFISGKDNSMMIGEFVSNEINDGVIILPDGFKLGVFKKNGKIVYTRVQNTNQNIDLLAKQLKRNNDLQTSRMLLDISKSLMGSKKNRTPLNLNNLNIGGGFLSGSSSSGMYKTCRYSSSLGTKTKTVFSSAPCPMAY